MQAGVIPAAEISAWLRWRHVPPAQHDNFEAAIRFADATFLSIIAEQSEQKRRKQPPTGRRSSRA